MAEGASCTGTRWLSIVGIGEDGIAGLSPMAQRLVSSAELVVGGKRHLDLAGSLISGRRLAWPNPIGDALPEIARYRGRPVTVLASGDPFHYGVGDLMMRSVPADEMICLPQPSAFSLAASRLGWSLQDTIPGQPAWPRAGKHHPLPPARRAHPGPRRGMARHPRSLRELLVERGLGASEMIVCEALGGERERIRRATAAGFDLEDVAALNTIGSRDRRRAVGGDCSASRPASMTRCSRTTASSPSARCARSRFRRWRRGRASCCGTSASAVARSPSNGCCGIRRCARSASRPTRRAPDTRRAMPRPSARPISQIVHGRAPETLRRSACTRRRIHRRRPFQPGPVRGRLGGVEAGRAHRRQRRIARRPKRG